MMRGMLNEESVSPAIFRRLSARFPDNADLIFGTMLERPGFSIERDLESLLMEFKPSHFKKRRLPMMLPLSERFSGALDNEPGPAERKLGRNKPCPRGSGRKYKKCCGR
jgi:hypothetical protein